MASAANLILRPYGSEIDFTLEHVNIENYSVEPMFAEDQVTPVGSNYLVSGSAVTHQANWIEIQNALVNNSLRVEYARLSNPSAPAVYLVNLIAEDSDIHGPFVKLTATQVIGSNLALIRWEITDRTHICESSSVASHTWTQKMDVDAAGKLTRTISGALRVYRSSKESDLNPATNSNWNDTANWADLFRRAILPELPAYGWRRESQHFAMDATGTVLAYEVVDKQYAHDLPNNVRVGDMTFTYERSAESAGVANIGVTVDLEGEIGLRVLNGSVGSTTGNRKLLEAAIALSKARIDASFKSVLITRMRVVENNILSGFSVRLEIDGMVFPTSAVGGGDPPTIPVVVPLANMIGRYFTVTRTIPRTIDAYGGMVIDGEVNKLYAMVPHWVGNTLNSMNCEGQDSDMPVATMLQFDGGAFGVGAITVTVTNSTEGMEDLNDSFVGEYSGSAQQNEALEGGASSIIAYNQSIAKVSVNSGVIRLASCDIERRDCVFQLQKPDVRITERVEISTVNKAPSRIYRPMPIGAYLVSEDWNVNFGRFDPQGQRTFTGIFERTIGLYYTAVAFDQPDPENPVPIPSGMTNNGFYPQTYTLGPSQDQQILEWRSPQTALNPTLTPTATDASQETTVSVIDGGASNTRYDVPQIPYATDAS